MLKRRQRRLVLLAGLAILIVGAGWAWRFSERRRDAPILAAAKRYGVEPELIKAVVWRESRFNPTVRGRAGEIGLMQLQEVPAQEWADAEHVEGFVHEHCLDPGTNTLAGTWYLKKLLKRYGQTDDPITFALADYNAGRGNVLKWNRGPAATNSVVFVDQIGFPGTRAYVESILRRRAWYRFLARLGLEG